MAWLYLGRYKNFKRKPLLLSVPCLLRNTLLLIIWSCHWRRKKQSTLPQQLGRWVPTSCPAPRGEHHARAWRRTLPGGYDAHLLPAVAGEMGKKWRPTQNICYNNRGLCCINQIKMFRSPLSWLKTPFLHYQWDKKIPSRFFSIKKVFQSKLLLGNQVVLLSSLLNNTNWIITKIIFKKGQI